MTVYIEKIIMIVTAQTSKPIMTDGTPRTVDMLLIMPNISKSVVGNAFKVFHPTKISEFKTPKVPCSGLPPVTLSSKPSNWVSISSIL